MFKFILITLISLTSFSIFSSEKDTYNFSWLDPDKEVFVLQNRKYRKAGSPYFTVGYGMTTSGAFVDATAIQGRFGYFFLEEFGFEVVYSKNSGEENVTAKSVRNEGGAGSVPFRRIMNNYFGGMLLWSPFYSKINTFNTVVYMDWIFGLGFAKVEETNNRAEFDTHDFDSLSETQTHTGPMWNVGARVYLHQNWSLRFDLTTVHYQAKSAKNDNPGDSWYINYDMTLSLGFNF